MPKKPPSREPITGQPFRDDDPMFTVIVTDYEPSVSREFFRRKMACLAAQTCKDFEVLVYHDGPKSQSYEDDLAGMPVHPDTRFIVTPSRIGDWGHTARDLGIRAARGRWIIHTNADNIFYPNLIEVLAGMVNDPQPWLFARPVPRYGTVVRKLLERLDRRHGTDHLSDRLIESRDPQILVYGIVMRGLIGKGRTHTRIPSTSERQGVVFGGVPVEYGSTDAMQLVMQRSLWLAEGGWSDRSMDSDGKLYTQFARKYRVLPVPAVLGEHW